MRVLSVRSKKLFFTVRVIVYCLKSIGLAPFSIPNGKPAQINSEHFPIEAFFVSNVGLAYNILLLIPVTVVPIIYKPNFIMELHSHPSSVIDILSAISTGETILFSLAGCLIIISWAFGQKNAACVMNRLLEVDLRLSRLKEQPFDKGALIFLTLHIIINASLWITYWLAIIIISKVENLLIEFMTKLPGFIIYWFIMEYITVVGLVSRDLESVNKYLLDYKQFGNYLCRPPFRNGIPAVVSGSNHSISQLATLKVLRGVRTTLFELCGDVSDFFSLPILFSIACCFIPIFEKLYTGFRAANYSSWILTITWVLIFGLKFIYPVVSLALNVTQTRKEAESTGPIVQKLLAEANTKEIKAELEQFSLQLLHEKVNFTAYGLFSLDSTLLQSMLGGVATYTIILMQFGSSVCNCNCNFNCNGTSSE